MLRPAGRLGFSSLPRPLALLCSPPSVSRLGPHPQFSLLSLSLPFYNSSEGRRTFCLTPVIYRRPLPLVPSVALPPTACIASPTPHPLAHSAAALASLLSLGCFLRLLPQSPAPAGLGAWLALLSPVCMAYPVTSCRYLISYYRKQFSRQAFPEPLLLIVAPSLLLGPHCFFTA